MRILYWLSSYLPEIGGIQTLTKDLVPALSQNHGHEIKVIAGQGSLWMPEVCEQDGITIHRHPFEQAITSNRPTAIIQANRWLQEVVNDFAPDLIHLHPCGGEFPFLTHLLRRNEYPLVLTIHNNYSKKIRDLSNSTFNTQGFVPSRAIVACSYDTRDYVLSNCPELAPKVSTIPNGIADQVHYSTPLPWEPPILQFCGRLSKQKRLDVLLDAFESLAVRHPTVRLRIIGDGPERQSVMEQRLGLRSVDRIELIGSVESSTIPNLLNQSTIVVLSSDYEGLPIAVLEAMRQARPVVGTAVGGMAEAVIDDVNGRIVEPNNPTALADALWSIILNRPVAIEMGKAGRLFFKERYSLDSCARSYDALYKSTVENL